MKTVFADPKHLTSSAYIRILLPLKYLKNTKNVTIIQRTAFENIAEAKNFLEKTNDKIVVDVDDSFYLMDEKHPEWDKYKSKIEAMDHVIKNADLTIVSSENLKKGYSKITKNVELVENSLDLKLWRPPLFKSRKKSDKLQLLYMGTATHESDFMMILPALEKVEKHRPGSFELTVIGVAKNIPNYPWIHRLSQPRGKSVYPKFVRWYLKQGPFDVGISPLKDTPFNSGKSDIKALDYLGAGIYPVMSDVPAYQTEVKPFVKLVKNTEDQWKNAIIDLIENPPTSEQIQSGRDYVKNKRNTKLTAKKLERLFKKL